MSLPVFQHAITDFEGNALPAAQVLVRREYDSSLSELYSDGQAVNLLSSVGAASADSDGVVEFFIAPGVYRIDATFGAFQRSYRHVTVHPINGQVNETGTTRTLELADAGNYLRFTNDAAITCTVPPASSVDFPIGTEILCRQAGDGQITFAPDAGVTINDPYDGTAITPGNGAVVWLRKIAADEWDVIDNKVERDFSGAKVRSTIALLTTDATLNVDDVVDILGYHFSHDGGGDTFIFGTGVHNGGTVIDPNRTFPTDWTNSTQVSAWFNNTGLTVDAWIRINWSRLRTAMFGVLYNSDKDYAAVNTLALNALSTVLGGNILTQSNGECVYNGWDLLEQKGFILEGTGRAFGSTTPGSKLVYLPLTGEALDIRNCSEPKFRDFCLDGGWIQENDPGSVPGDYPDSVTSIGFQSSNATYVDYERLNILRFSKGIATDPFHATDSVTVYTINLYSVNFSGCHYGLDYGYQCNNFNMRGGLITNCAYAVRWQNGGANVNFWGVDLQVQGYDQRAGYWEEADSHLFDLTKNQQFGLHGCYVEINGNDYANGQQYLGELDQVQGFTIDNLYCASVTSMDPATAMINANDSVGIEVSGISPYNFPANMTWVNCTGTTNPVLVWGRNNVFHSGHRLVDNSFAPVLHLNGSAEAGVTYGANNEGMAIFDGTRITFKGLLEVTNWGSLTAGGYIGIELPTEHAPANILAAVMANGISYDAAGGTLYMARILPATSNTVRIFDASTFNAVTQTDAPAGVYFEISYEPYLENI